MLSARVVAVETLDHLAAGDRAMGTRDIVARGWHALLPSHRLTAPLKVLELGAGDGRLLLGVARALKPAWPTVHLSLLDRQDIVSPPTLAAYAELGWTAKVIVADVLDWAAPNETAPAWDLITTTLFLHHFQGAQLAAVLAAAGARSRRFFACEPRRTWLALAGSHLVGALGANAVTREDAVLSVRAGFRGHELTALWPGSTFSWQCHEHTAGLFSHCFSARRNGAR